MVKLRLAGKSVWKTVVVSGTKPETFAKSLEKNLNYLSEEGFEITNLIQRGKTLVLVGLKQEPPSKEEVESVLKESLGVGIAPVDPGKLS